MPEIFLLVHPVGSVYGAASYGNYFVGYQNCTIGADGKEYPVLGEGVVCYSRTSIIGKCKVGNNVVMGANTFIINCEVDSDTLVLGSYPKNRFIRREECARLQFYD
jgi:serine O-acetyltransferase